MELAGNLMADLYNVTLCNNIHIQDFFHKTPMRIHKSAAYLVCQYNIIELEQDDY